MKGEIKEREIWYTSPLQGSGALHRTPRNYNLNCPRPIYKVYIDEEGSVRRVDNDEIWESGSPKL